MSYRYTVGINLLGVVAIALTLLTPWTSTFAIFSPMVTSRGIELLGLVPQLLFSLIHTFDVTVILALLMYHSVSLIVLFLYAIYLAVSLAGPYESNLSVTLLKIGLVSHSILVLMWLNTTEVALELGSYLVFPIYGVFLYQEQRRAPPGQPTQ